MGGVKWYPARLIDFAMTTSNQLHQSSLARFQPGPNRLEALSDLKPRPPVAARHRGQAFLMLAFIACLALPAAVASDPAALGVNLLPNLAYKSGDGRTDYEKERCKLDLYLPVGKKAFPTLVWFHGGGLTGGLKDDSFTTNIVRSLVQSGMAVAAVNYRLSPKAKYPAYIEDAAAAFAWVRTNIAAHGGNPNRVFIGGHSAGGYLTFMVGLDERYLRPYGLDSSAIAGLIPLSGQTLTHYTIREERGKKSTLMADDAAPVYHARKDTPPMLVLYAERDMAMRIEENQLLVAALKSAGNTRVTARLIADRDHGSIASNIPQPGDPVHAAIVEFIKPAAAATPGGP